ncbi:hypothetical protein GCM10010168_23750 [Actinoplanes ianthinogenes]|uniref:Peptidase S8/S53 domain-containing protein n=1 Tax=Actinoplanes ianthinogenes TaxID=122358 RepID=A0ABN6CS48_9ACTN|nr:S8 family serine peptidase [Actinoplanes ianthinogenes]BCJ48016.1 hypothetical protein Aiant_86730 [Actinoplanes ianthinogenes]GGR05791.1 hypothetical protein GCM10010168_23750 [Actinoplanes ianthinogenes]
MVWRLWTLVACAPLVPVVHGPYPAVPVASGAGVRVAVVDSGVDPSNGQVAGRVAAGRGGRDCVGHGTAVAASVLAVAPRAVIVPVRVGDGDPGDAGGVARVAEGIRWAAGPGHAQVINISLVVAADDRRVRSAVAEALGRGVVVVAAVGNQPGAGRRFPAGYPGVIGVGAILSSGEPAPFSPAGPDVDLVAVGDGGTSFAAGFVSGAAALVRERFPGASAGEVARRLAATADAGRRLNPYRAVTAAGSGPLAAPSPFRYAHSNVTPRRRAYWPVVAALGAGAVAAVIGAVVARARRRRWRPAAQL